MNTLESLPDQILRIAIVNNNQVDLGSMAMLELYRRDHTEFIKALVLLESARPPYIVQDRLSMNLNLTPAGIEFIQRGGYCGRYEGSGLNDANLN